MNDKIFQEVFDIIYPVLPAYWKKMVLYVAYTDGSYSMKFYTMDEKNIYNKVLDMVIVALKNRKKGK